MKLNTKVDTLHTHEGAKASHINSELQLRRSVMSCLLWEDNFYESGESVADRIKELIPKVDPIKVVQIAREARDKMNLRHVPLLIVREMARHATHKKYVSRTLQYVIKRPDELTEFLAIYWKDGKCPLSKKVKQGLARAFNKFSEYELAKYNHDSKIKLRDVLFLSHSKPKDEQQAELYKKLINNELQTPDTWEVALSSGANKKEAFERLISEKKLGALATIRNLRNMKEAGISKDFVYEYLSSLNFSKILPYRFIAAAKEVPEWEDILEQPILKTLNSFPKDNKHTILLIDVSGSMDKELSNKGKMTRLDAACAIAIIAREIYQNISILTFSNQIITIPSRHGFALKDSIFISQSHSGTYLGNAINNINNNLIFDRIIIITDEQSSDDVPKPKCENSYLINVANYKNGIDYGNMTHIDGFSANVLEYIKNIEQLS
jgi:hypothetical protein